MFEAAREARRPRSARQSDLAELPLMAAERDSRHRLGAVAKRRRFSASNQMMALLEGVRLDSNRLHGSNSYQPSWRMTHVGDSLARR